MLTAEQRKERINYIGASEAAAVLGLSRWATPLSVWAEKTGQVVPEDMSDNLAVELGNELEDFVARKFTQKTGKAVVRSPETLYHPRHKFIAANLDRRVVGENSVLECKTCAAWKAKEWDGDDFPPEYVIQVMHQMAVTGAEKGYLAVLIGNQDFKVKEVIRDQDALDLMIRREVEFWEKFVVTKGMPMVMASDKDTLSQLFPEAEVGSLIELPSEATAICEVLEGVAQDEKSLKAQKEKLRNQLRAMMGKNEIGTSGPWMIKWGNVPGRFQAAELKEAHPDIYEKFKATSTTRKLLIDREEQKNG